MAKKKKNIDTIKIEGLSSDTIEEFAPKDNSENEDKLWEEYFKGSRNVLEFPKKEQTPSLSIKETETKKTTAATSATNATTVAKATTVDKSAKTDKSNNEYITLDSTHTKSEQIVYSIM